MAVFVQAPLHTLKPATFVHAVQALAEHVWLTSHIVPQALQFTAEVARSEQEFGSQRVRLVPQVVPQAP